MSSVHQSKLRTSTRCLQMTRSVHKSYKITEIEQYHVISGDEGVVDSNELHIVTLKCDSGDQPPDPSEPYQNAQERISKSSQPNHIPIGTMKSKSKKSRGNRPLMPILIFPATTRKTKTQHEILIAANRTQKREILSLTHGDRKWDPRKQRNEASEEEKWRRNGRGRKPSLLYRRRRSRQLGFL